jgi:hypothetical protein
MHALRYDPTRGDVNEHRTGFYVRALDPEGHPVSIDIALLDRESLLTWLRSMRSRNGLNPWAGMETIILHVLGYPPVVGADSAAKRADVKDTRVDDWPPPHPLEAEDK